MEHGALPGNVWNLEIPIIAFLSSFNQLVAWMYDGLASLGIKTVSLSETSDVHAPNRTSQRAVMASSAIGVDNRSMRKLRSVLPPVA